MTAYRASLIWICALMLVITLPASVGARNAVAIPAAVISGLALGGIVSILIRSRRHRAE